MRSKKETSEVIEKTVTKINKEFGVFKKHNSIIFKKNKKNIDSKYELQQKEISKIEGKLFEEKTKLNNIKKDQLKIVSENKYNIQLKFNEILKIHCNQNNVNEIFVKKIIGNIYEDESMEDELDD